MIYDTNKKLWLGTVNGLYRFDPNDNKTQIFTVADGLPANEFNRRTATISTDGIICMGTVKGAVSFNPALVLPQNYNSKLFFTHVLVNGKRISFPENNNTIHIKEGESVQAFYSLVDFRNNSHPKFRYRLIGFSDEWIETSESKMSYLNIPSGTYYLEIAGSTELADWQTPLSIRIDVSWLWWKKILFTVVLITSLILWFWKKSSIFLRKNATDTLPVPLQLQPTNVTTFPENKQQYDPSKLSLKVIHIIRENYSDSEFNVMTIQEKLNISKVHLHRKMIAETGQTAAWHVKDIRMRVASRMLIENMKTCRLLKSGKLRDRF